MLGGQVGRLWAVGVSNLPRDVRHGGVAETPRCRCSVDIVPGNFRLFGLQCVGHAMQAREVDQRLDVPGLLRELPFDVSHDSRDWDALRFVAHENCCQCRGRQRDRGARENGYPCSSHSRMIAREMQIQPLTDDRFDDFAGLIQALAAYERLPGPDAEAIQRLRADALGPRPRFEAALAVDDAGHAIGYAIWFETYSSLLARPTLYLEDLFVIEHARGTGAGGRLFDHVHALGRERGCGRMDWQVLDWNTSAREFSARRGAQCLASWLTHRIEY